MNKELDNYLCHKYPKIFVERNLSPMESCMGRGFECNSGWCPIIDSLCHQIQEHIDGHNEYAKQRKEGTIPQFVALQIKEKFGSLRVYYKGGDVYCQGLVDMAATWSWSTCEVCGKGGKRHVGHTKGWIGSICDECSPKIKRKIGYDKEIKSMLAKAIKQDTKRYV